MNERRILAIGIDPAFADLSAHPELSVERVRAYIDQQMDQIRARGYEVDSCLVDPGDTAEQAVERLLRSREYGCIVFGAGLREPPALLMLFERLLNLVHQLAPHSRIAFNTNPADTVTAAQRWIG
ncbi:hypothetical protein [Burkholderia anthina]|uniref:hypothetical protein n=1 Tax=Burkholderia anthina TaxID=179879 RepID=UPI0037C17F52